MSPPESRQPTDDAPTSADGHRPTDSRGVELPSWLMSLVFHAVVLMALAFLVRWTPQQVGSAERTADVGIALKHSEGPRDYYETEETSSASTDVVASSSDLSIEAMLAEQAPIDVSEVLPGRPAIGPGAIESGGPVGPGREVGPAAGAVSRLGGQGSSTFFGLTGEGFRFAYVLDRSGSMGGSGRSALRAAQEELVSSIQTLGDTHQFVIIFYNEQAAVFNPAGGQKLPFATEQTKRRAAKFIRSITADGRTRHYDALRAAINRGPDVIFFLTDADDPLSPREMHEIENKAAGITIYTVQFGMGPQQGSDNFLIQLARRSGGQHVYVDLHKLRPAGR